MTSEQILSLFKRLETKLTINVYLVGGLIFLHTMEWISIPRNYWKILLLYTALNLMATPFAIKHRFVTPNIAAPKCHYCGSYMISTKLECPKCKSTSENINTGD